MRTERDKLTDLEIEVSKQAMFGHALRKMTNILFKQGDVTFERAKQLSAEMLNSLNLFETDTVLSLYALWLADRLKPPCTDEYWQHTLDLLANAIAEGWRLSQTQKPPPLITGLIEQMRCFNEN